MGSIPLHIFYPVGLLTIIALWALAYAVELSSSIGKEKNMEKENYRINRTKNIAHVVSSLATTIWAIGTSIWSGLALSG